MELQLISGSFYEGIEKIPIEIGNIKQINILKKIGAIRPINNCILDKEVTPIELDYSVFGRRKIKITNFVGFFKCTCGDCISTDVNEALLDYNEDEIDVMERLLENEIAVCKKCKKEYTIKDGKAILNK